MSDILVERRDEGIAVVTINRPERLNALTREAVAALNATLDGIAADSGCRAVILTGAGRGFCSGQDLAAANARKGDRASGVIEKLFWQEQFAGMGKRLRSMPQLVVAAVNGPAVGAGMAIALSADVRIATPSARFLVAAVRIGLSAGESGISYLLPRMIGIPRAFDILLTGRPIEAEEAERIGLVLRLAEPAALVDEAIGYARTVLANSPYSVAHSKKLMWENLDASFDAAIGAENRTQILATMTQDYAEATAAFVEKRPPRFEGR
ncbi:enoyl-CoA hydratase/isomerase family protein [Rhizorhabdus wittichii]|uniref:Enoyl-CoA hydratase/isomerase family protein n=1 Tax=Rhizorhabdus wittichii TaxID=160791 RepID=A0A975HER8_9SPHN|nr:enoyl-CoA hydratase-related protein [Rhizorhabdus wittichii]QTH22617.1 enoyl-CoA hydratase/isomerase family protein [Rhizorhabdus wittichii]